MNMGTSELKKIGFAGLGIMGSRMAKNLARKGFGVVVWNRTREKAEAVAKEVPGIEVATTPAALAAQVDAFCTCVSDPAALTEVCFSGHGLFAGARKGQLFIDYSTMSVELERRLYEVCREKGMDFVEAPVTGSKGGAEKGTLLVMAGGTEEALARAKPVMDAVSEKLIRCGEVGAGTQVKLAGNSLIALMLQGLSEGMLLARKAGVDPRKLLEVVQASGYRSPYFDFKGRQLMERDFEAHFTIDMMFKDLSLFIENAARNRVPTPCAAAVRETYQLARASGRGDLDIAAVAGALEDVCGVKIGGQS